MRVMIRWFLCLLVLLSLVGCSAARAKPQAEAVAQKYFAAMKEGKVEDVLDLYAKEFYEDTPREKWKGMLRSMNKKLGNVRSCELTGWSIKTVTGTGNSGTYVTLTYAVHYENSAGAETFQMYKPSFWNSTRIVAHTVDSEGLLPGEEEQKEQKGEEGEKIRI